MSGAASESARKHFILPQLIIARFVAKSTFKSAAFWAFIFAIAVTAKGAGYAAAYPTARSRGELAASFGNNIGLSALFGTPHDISTVTGFAVWNTLTIMVIIGAIWAFLTAAKRLRGEEEAGRWEILLAGQTTARRACINALLGLGTSLVVMYVVAAVLFVGIGKIHTVNYGVQAGLFFALAGVASATMFMAVGALAAQLMPTRSRAASLSAAVFGACFLVRAMADSTKVHWLLNVTPLGWVEKLQPLYGSQPVWLIPIGTLTLVCAVAAVIVAGRRDLGESVFPDNDTAEPHFALLKSPLRLALRLSRGASISWLLAAGFVAAFFGVLAKSAASAFSHSSSLSQKFGTITHASQASGARIFLGVVFFILMAIIMATAASAMTAVRREEADGYLDNLLVRAVSRTQWLWGRIILIALIVVCAGVVASLGSWLGLSRQGLGIAYSDLFLAGMNAVAPAILIMGLGVFALGVLPRATSLVVYGALAWSFLIDLLSSGLTLNHWLLDTSIMQHMTLAPATNPNWTAVVDVVGLGIAFCFLGSLAFNRRDLEAE